jgi:hypothetical protein
VSRVGIQFERVQTWLFAVPRLRPIVSANGLHCQSPCVGLPTLTQETRTGWTLAPTPSTWSPTDTSLGQPLVAAVLRELGAQHPGALCAERLRTIRDRLRAGPPS